MSRENIAKIETKEATLGEIINALSSLNRQVEEKFEALIKPIKNVNVIIGGYSYYRSGKSLNEPYFFLPNSKFINEAPEKISLKKEDHLHSIRFIWNETSEKKDSSLSITSRDNKITNITKNGKPNSFINLGDKNNRLFNQRFELNFNHDIFMIKISFSYSQQALGRSYHDITSDKHDRVIFVYSQSKRNLGIDRDSEFFGEKKVQKPSLGKILGFIQKVGKDYFD